MWRTTSIITHANSINAIARILYTQIKKKKIIMQNWKSITSEYTPIVKQSTMDLARQAKYLKSIGISIDSIAIMLDRSKSRVYEYLKPAIK